jgi:hypothetical protein
MNTTPVKESHNRNENIPDSAQRLNTKGSDLKKESNKGLCSGEGGLFNFLNVFNIFKERPKDENKESNGHKTEVTEFNLNEVGKSTKPIDDNPIYKSRNEKLRSGNSLIKVDSKIQKLSSDNLVDLSKVNKSKQGAKYANFSPNKHIGINSNSKNGKLQKTLSSGKTDILSFKDDISKKEVQCK